MPFPDRRSRQSARLAAPRRTAQRGGGAGDPGGTGPDAQHPAATSDPREIAALDARAQGAAPAGIGGERLAGNNGFAFASASLKSFAPELVSATKVMADFTGSGACRLTSKMIAAEGGSARRRRRHHRPRHGQSGPADPSHSRKIGGNGLRPRPTTIPHRAAFRGSPPGRLLRPPLGIKSIQTARSLSASARRKVLQHGAGDHRARRRGARAERVVPIHASAS